MISLIHFQQQNVFAVVWFDIEHPTVVHISETHVNCVTWFRLQHISFFISFSLFSVYLSLSSFDNVIIFSALLRAPCLSFRSWDRVCESARCACMCQLEQRSRSLSHFAQLDGVLLLWLLCFYHGIIPKPQNKTSQPSCTKRPTNFQHVHILCGGRTE